jgi:hypothetical protein
LAPCHVSPLPFLVCLRAPCAQRVSRVVPLAPSCPEHQRTRPHAPTHAPAQRDS